MATSVMVADAAGFAPPEIWHFRPFYTYVERYMTKRFVSCVL